MSEWKTIDSAPKDGTEVLAWRVDCGPFIARYTSCDAFMTDNEIESSGIDEESLFSKDWFYADFIQGGRADGSETPTHWMPLPADPEPTP